ncbi:MAG TPA: hypothetical protein VIK18_17110 [Pirellulales bacterium]
MTAAPARRPEPRLFLDASLVPLERALRARADALDERTALTRSLPANVRSVEAEAGYRSEWLAAEFRALADELHHW